MKIFCWHRIKWSDVKQQDLQKIPIGLMYPAQMRGRPFVVTEWFQEAYCQKCNKYFFRKIER